MPNASYSILIVDPDRRFLDTISSDPAAKKIPPVLVYSANEAEQVLGSPEHSFAAIFINPVVTGKGGLSLIKASHQRRPGVPVFLLYAGNEPFAPRELNRLAIHEAVGKPVTYKEMTSMVSSSIFSKEPPHGAEIIDAPSPQDRQYIAVPIQTFFSGTKSFFDVYVRVSSGRYLKILPANESITEERLKTYVEKNVTHFYLSRASQEKCLCYCDALAAVLLSHTDVSVEMKMARAMTEGDDILKDIRVNGLDELHCEYASAFIDHVRNLIHVSGTQQSSLVTTCLGNSTSYEHAVSTTVIASLLTLPLKIEASSAYHIVGLAAMLHDVGLNHMPKAVQLEDETQMTPEELELYRTHPRVSAEIVDHFKSLDPSVIQAVLQHHERRSGQGFPAGLGAGQINRVAEIIGIADEYVRRIQRAERLRKADPSYDPLASMEEVYDEFSQPVVDAFKSIFPHKKPEVAVKAKTPKKKKKSSR